MEPRKGKKMIQIVQQVRVDAEPDTVALTLRKPGSIASFPGVKAATVADPGMHLQVQPIGLPIHDELTLSWRKPFSDEIGSIQTFGIDGKHIHGVGKVSLDAERYAATTIGMTWEVELPWSLRLVPGMHRAVRRSLDRSTKQWLEAMKGSLEARMASISDLRFNAGDVGA